jgi:integrase
MGSVYLRGAIWWISFHFRGKRYYESSGSRVKSDAIKLLRKRQGETGRGHLLGPDVERTTFEDLAEMIRDDYRINDRKSSARVDQAIAHLQQFFGLYRALNITADRVAAYIRSRQEGDRPVRPATIRYELSVLKRMFTLAIQAGKLDRRPYVPSIEVRNTRTGFFEARDLTAFLDHLPEEIRPIARFAYLTGWRRGEILVLQWRQVDFRAGVVRLEPGTTKNDEGRVFPFAILPELAELLRTQREETTTIERDTGRLIPWVFHRDGRPVSDFRGAWARACRKAGVPDKLFHDFRRTAVRNLERAGVSRSVAMKLTGHKTEAIYRRYAIVSESDLAEGVKKLAALHQEGATPRVIELDEARQSRTVTKP